MADLSRRRFLKQGTFAAGASLVTMAQRAWAQPLKWPIGIQLYTVGQELQKDVGGTLKRIRTIGYTEVETAGFAGLTAKQFRDELDRTGLGCHSAHMQMNVPDLGPVFDDAHALGVHYVVSSALFPGGAGAQPTVELYKQMGHDSMTLLEKHNSRACNMPTTTTTLNLRFWTVNKSAMTYCSMKPILRWLTLSSIAAGWSRQGTARSSISANLLVDTKCFTSRILSQAAK